MVMIMNNKHQRLAVTDLFDDVTFGADEKQNESIFNNNVFVIFFNILFFFCNAIQSKT